MRWDDDRRGWGRMRWGRGVGGGDGGDVVLGGVWGRWALRKPPLVGVR